MLAGFVLLAMIALVVRVAVEYLSERYAALVGGVFYCDIALYVCLGLVVLMAALKIVFAIRKRKCRIWPPIVATAAVGVLYGLFVWLGERYSVVTPWVPCVEYALIGLAVLTVIFVAVRVIIEIMPKKEREVKV